MMTVKKKAKDVTIINHFLRCNISNNFKNSILIVPFYENMPEYPEF